MGYVPDGHVNDWQRKNDGHHDVSASKACDWICNLCKCQVQPQLFMPEMNIDYTVIIIEFEPVMSLTFSS